ncbi:MAG: hypothetical protein V4487_08460, partial [Chlamydiota bacterium]
MAIAVKRADFSSNERKDIVVDIAEDQQKFDFIGSFNALGRDVTKINSVLIEMDKKLDLFRKGEIIGSVEELRPEVEKCEKAFAELKKKIGILDEK